MDFKLASYILLSMLSVVFTETNLQNGQYLHPHQAVQKLEVLHKASSEMTPAGYREILNIADALSPLNVLQGLTNDNLNISDLCGQQVLYTLSSLNLNLTDLPGLWADKMIDAWGRPAAGILEGGLRWLGNYDECLRVQSLTNPSLSQDLNFQGKYCTLGSPKTPENPMAPSAATTIGGCFPSGCSEDDINKVILSLIHTVSSNTNITEDDINTECQVELEYSNSAIAAIVLYCIMGVICILGTLYDVMFIIKSPTTHSGNEVQVNGSVNEHIKGGDDDTAILINPHVKQEGRKHGAFGEFLMCFSLYTNGYKLLNTSQPAGALTCLNGIRFISMMWVILGHTIAFSINTLGNFYTVYSWTKRFTFCVVSNATVSVDSFFVLSAILTTYLFLKDLEKRKPGLLKFLTSVPIMYLHRYIRLTPAYGFMILFYACLLLYLYEGPLKPTHTTIADPNCADYSWTSLLYINNVIKPDHMCAGWGWYLSNDFQFYLVTPFVVYLMYLVPVVGLILASAMVLASNGAATGISVKYDLSLSLLGARDPNNTDPAGQGNLMQKYYFAPWARYQSFGVGVLFGYVLWKCRGKLPVNKVTNLILWGVSAALCLSVLYGPYDVDSHGHVASVSEAAMYNGWSRTAWSIGLGYVILACCTGRGGWVNEFLSWPGFVPLSRMTYCAYLVHPVIMTVISGSHKNLMDWDTITFIYLFAAYLTLSYGVAFLFSIMFEAPFMLIDKKYLTGRFARSSSK